MRPRVLVCRTVVRPIGGAAIQVGAVLEAVTRAIAAVREASEVVKTTANPKGKIKSNGKPARSGALSHRRRRRCHMFSAGAAEGT